MISSVFALKEANTIPEYLLNNKETTLEENYYTNSTLDFLLETHNELLSYRKDFYKNIMEAGEGNPCIINEAFVDILDKIQEIIKKILAYIESIINKFKTQIMKFIRSDKYLIKMKSTISKFPNSEYFYITGYKFTFDNNVPIVDIAGLDLSEIENIINREESIDSKIETITGMIYRLSDQVGMDDIRGEILNLNYGIQEANFNNEVFSIFRDHKSEESEIKIDKEYITNALKYFDGYSDEIKSLKRLQSNIKYKYNNLKIQVEKIIKDGLNVDGSIKFNTRENIDRFGSDIIEDFNTSLNRLLTNQVSYIQKISTYHLQAISAKLDAYNALAIQDRNVLYRALSIIQKDINTTRIMGENYTSYDYTKDATYKEYLLKKYNMNQEQKRFINECLLLCESNIPELKAIHEDLKMDTKNFFEKVKNAIKEIFQKFLMKMNKILLGDKEFLKKYKDIILNKKVEEYELNNMPDYEAGISNIKSHKLKRLNLNDIISKDESQIQSELLNTYKGDGDFVDFTKRYFLCDNRPNKDTVKSSTLNMNKIYDFCVNAPNAIKTLENDLKEFTMEANNIQSKVLSTLTESTIIDIYGEKYYYSSVLESFINEDKQDVKNDTTSQSNATNTNKENSNSNAKLDLEPSREDNNKNKDLDKKVKSHDKSTDADKQAEDINNKQNVDKAKVKSAVTDYINTIKTITVTAKITAFEKIYSEYMKILRYHVSKATGSMGSTSKFSEEDVKSITNAMKEYKNATDKNQRDNAAKKIIDIYKNNNIVIDYRDVKSLVDKNSKKL